MYIESLWLEPRTVFSDSLSLKNNSNMATHSTTYYIRPLHLICSVAVPSTEDGNMCSTFFLQPPHRNK